MLIMGIANGNVTTAAIAKLENDQEGSGGMTTVPGCLYSFHPLPLPPPIGG